MDGGQWSQDMPGRPRARATPRDSHERHPGGRRSLDHPHYMMESEEMAGHHHSSQREMAGRRSREHEVSLEEGIQHLFESVNAAIEFFARFTQDYQQDIHRIGRYCNKHVMELVWQAKAQGSSRVARGGRSGRRRGEHEYDVDREERMQPPSLHTSLTQLLSSLSATIRVAEDSRSSQRRSSRYKTDDVAKILQQLQRAHHSLRKSFLVVMEKRSEMEHMTTELEMLSVFLGRNGAGGNADGGAGGGGRPSERRRMAQSEAGGPNPFVEEVPDEPEEEWNGGQEAE
ncbi:MAG: hypothetical protein L6R36_006289 [Xanthoria steineri]|nr:MAG: hypothetical protein L6R36_006289 [Xanthoria steineri]